MNPIETLNTEEQEKLEKLLLAGLNSGEATPLTTQDFQEIRAEVRRRALARKEKIDDQPRR